MTQPIFLPGWLDGATELIITSPMGKRNGRMHKGIDIRAKQGTNLYAPLDGTIVTKRVQKEAAGLYVTLRYDVNGIDYFDILFMHLHSADVNVGQKIKAGEKLGTTGGDPSDKPNCGAYSTGPHLHLEIRQQGATAVSPFPFLCEVCKNKGNNKVLWAGQQFNNQTPIVTIPETALADQDALSETDETASDVEHKKKKKIVGGIQDRLAPGIWQIIKLIQDSSVANRQIFDSSIAIQTGSLINFFNKICQPPLVEFSGDTYGDQYYFIVRKPPFDEEGIKRMQDLTLLTINPSDIRSTALSWNSENIYSWYQLLPYMEFGNMPELSLYSPAVFFPEYAAVWGSRDLTVQDQYVNYFASGEANQSVDNALAMNGDNIIRNAIRDLKYIIECNAYNPFVRQGTITLNGDRRIKRGTLILMPNGEQFYVDEVSNNFSVNLNSVERTTTLTVSHGMMAQYIHGFKPSEWLKKKISYFNIIDFGIPEGQTFEEYLSKITLDKWKEAVSKWKVDIDVFNFFMKRSQILK